MRGGGGAGFGEGEALQRVGRGSRRSAGAHVEGAALMLGRVLRIPPPRLVGVRSPAVAVQVRRGLGTAVLPGLGVGMERFAPGRGW